jgi:HEAT repeat protein
MNESVQYAKSLALLVQEVRAQANPDALRTLLIRARGYSRAAGLVVELRDHQLLLDGRITRQDSGGFDALIQAMRDHGIAKVGISEGASPKELLRLAVLLAKTPPQSKADATIFEDAREMSLWFVRLHPAEREVETAITAGAHELGGLEMSVARAKAKELIQQIVDATQQNNDIRAAALLRLLMDAERVSDTARACWTEAFDEAVTPAALRLVALALPNAGDDRNALLALLRRAGAAGANAVITQLMASEQVESRRAYFDAVVELQAGVPLLIDMLRHPQWYVVRNCALLLGEMRATDAVPMLGQMLSHEDHRVRIAVSTALAQIDTPAARSSLQQALRDESSEVRRRALRGFSGELGGASSAALVRALDKEEDPEVQVEILAAMGRIRSPDAVQKLIRLCSPMAGTSSGSFRIAAAEALTTARGQAAVPFLRAMLEDRDPNVRTTARALINSVTASR